MEYTYDLFDRRIARQVDADGTAGFETTQRFVYDGEDLILAFSGSTNVLTNRYLYGPATDEILADERIATGTAGTVTWSLGDNLGTIRDLVQYNATTGTTTVVNHVRYDTFGQIVSQTNSQFQPWFAYTGREWDPATGLYFYRARWYDPRAGRFLSEDPIGFAAGDVNLNRYVGNAATLWVDPSGMEPAAPTQDPAREYADSYLAMMQQMQFAVGSPVSTGGNSKWDFINVYRPAPWWNPFGTPTFMGSVAYAKGNPDEHDLAIQIAAQMERGLSLKEIKAALGAGITATQVLIRLAYDPLDNIASAVECAHDPSVSNFLAMLPIVPGAAKPGLELAKDLAATESKIVKRGLSTVADDAATAMARAEARLANVPAAMYPLNRQAKDDLRSAARGIWQSRTSRRAVWDDLDVHHRIPLEWAHLFPHSDPNRIANLIGMTSTNHTLVTNAWNAWTRGLNGRIPSQAEVLEQAIRIDEQFGHLMRFLPPEQMP